MQPMIAELVGALDELAYLATALGLPMALLIYWRDVRRSREEREVGTYAALDDKYLHYLELCLQHPHLNIYVYPLVPKRSYSAEENVQRYAMFETVISIAERAFLRYRGHSSEKRRKQWSGWEAYLQDWKCHPDYPELWDRLGTQFDTDFVDFVNGLKPAEKLPPTISATPKARRAA